MRNISSQALSLHAVLCPSHHGQAVVEKQLFENYCWPVTQSPTFQTSCFGNHVAWSWEGQTCSSHVEGSESKEDGNLFPCLNVFRPLLASSGSEKWGFWLKGWNPTCPPHFIVGMLGRLVRSCLRSRLTGMCSCCPTWIMLVRFFFYTSFFFSHIFHKSLATCTDVPMSWCSSPSASTLWVIHLWSVCQWPTLSSLSCGAFP